MTLLDSDDDVAVAGQQQFSGQCHFIQFHRQAIVALSMAN